MLFKFFSKKNANQNNDDKAQLNKVGIELPPFTFSWVITGKLAIGSMPRSIEDWRLLESNDIKKRFSCCYIEEHVFTPIPSDWESREISLPDHRSQEELTAEKLIYALNEIIQLIEKDSTPVYLHCFAGQERSSLLAVGAVCLLANKDLFEALAWVRQCHKRARPLYHQLDILEKALNKFSSIT
jgi:hypothetical protein